MGLSVFPVLAVAQSQTAVPAQTMAVSSSGTVLSAFDQFAPKPQTKSTRIDYAVWDDALRHAVVYLGPSTRRHMSRPAPLTGTRFITGHRSAYRLEGSRVRFSELNDEYKAAIAEYRRDLERVANQIDITRMSRDEQLAYWLNLHNAALIEQISKQYPKQYPSELKIDGVPLHDAKILMVKGTPLSLRDIREKIVYPNWSSPTVLYGFFLGDIGGPMIQNYAFTGGDVNAHLRFNAEEFVNSLRGVHEGARVRKVSKIYDEARQFYFPNFEVDLTAHLLTYARPDVAEDIRADKPIEVDRYDQVVADMEGGERARIASYQITNPQGQVINVNGASFRYLQELDNKFETLKKRGLVGTGTGTVTIEDIPTIDIGTLPGTTSTTAPKEPESQGNN